MSKKDNDGTLGGSNNNITSLSNINVSKVVTYGFQDLPSIIKLLSENGIINLLPLKPGSKEPKVKEWTPYKSKRYPLKDLKRHKGNYALITGDPLNQGVGNLVIFDIDDKEGPGGLYKHFKDIDTLQVKTARKGYHLYFWSKHPVKDINYLKTLFNQEIELRGNPGSYVVLPPSSVKYPDGFIGSHEVIKEGKEDPIMDLDDVQDFIKNKLIEAGYKPDNSIKEDITPIELTPGVINKGRWIRTLEDEETNQLVELLKPLYIEGQRHYLTLYVSGWMYKAEIDMNSAIQVIKELANNKPEWVNNGFKATKWCYRRRDDALKGSSGVYELIKNYYKTQNKDIEKEKERLDKTEIETKEYYGRIARLINHPNSILGVKIHINTIKEGKKGKSRAIKKIHQFLKARYDIIKDKTSGELVIYDPEKGYYEFQDNNSFQEFLSTVFNDEIFTLDETKTVKGIFARMEEPSNSHIVFENGILNLETLELEDFTPDYLLTFKIPYEWNPTAKGNYVEEKLQEILIDKEGEDKEERDKYHNFLELVGYVLGEPGNPKQKIFLYIGPPASGKTQLINLIAGLLKDGVSSVPLQQFKDRFGLQALIGKRVNTLFDISEEEINDPSVIKAVSGNDSITIDRKFKESITYEKGLPVKTIGAGNVLPKIKDESQAMARRLNITKVNNEFSKKPIENLSEKLLEDKEGIEWLIHEGISKYYEMKEENRGFTLDFTPQEMQELYLKLSDPCRYAMERLYEFTNNENDFYSSTEFVTSINRLLEEEGLRIPKDTRYNHHPAIRAIGGEYTQRRIGGERVWCYSLLKARYDEKDPKRTRFDKETLIQLKPNRKKDILRDGSEHEKALMELMPGLTPYNLTGVKIEAREYLDIDNKEFMKILNKWKNEEALTIDNSVYYKDK
jgi:phage/plasmid-associated DNA primase